MRSTAQLRVIRVRIRDDRSLDSAQAVDVDVTCFAEETVRGFSQHRSKHFNTEAQRNRETQRGPAVARDSGAEIATFVSAAVGKNCDASRVKPRTIARSCPQMG